MWSRNQRWIKIENEFISKRPNFPFNCFVLDLHHHPQVQREGIQQIFFKILPGLNTHVEIFPEDKQLASNRPLKSNIFHFSGNRIKMHAKSNRTHARFALKVKKTMLEPKDKSTSCMKYPSEAFDSYNACDDQFLEESLPPGLHPIWAAKNMSDVTSEIFISDMEKYSFEDLRCFCVN